MRSLTENLDAFGLPQAEDEPMDEAKRVNYKGLLSDLMAAVEVHMQVMAGTAEEGAEDTLEAVMSATKEALEPKEDEEGEEEVAPEGDVEPQAEMS